jgi:uncharacterized protein
MSANELSTIGLNIERAQALFQAVEYRDPEGVLAIYDEKIVINEAPSLPYGGEYHDHEGALRHGMGFRTAWDHFQPWSARGLQPYFIAQGDHVAVLWRHKAKRAETGEKIDLPAVSIYRFIEGKIVDSRMFHFDTARLLHFLRIAPGTGPK